MTVGGGEEALKQAKVFWAATRNACILLRAVDGQTRDTQPPFKRTFFLLNQPKSKTSSLAWRHVAQCMQSCSWNRLKNWAIVHRDERIANVISGRLRSSTITIMKLHTSEDYLEQVYSGCKATKREANLETMKIWNMKISNTMANLNYYPISIQD